MDEYEAVRQETYMTMLTECLNERLLEISGLHRKNTCLYQKISQMEEQLFRVEQENVTLEGQLQCWQKQEDAIKRDLCSAREKLEEVRLELRSEKEKKEQIVQENIFLQERIAQMESSKSWKITKLFRTLLWKIKGK